MTFGESVECNKSNVFKNNAQNEGKREKKERLVPDLFLLFEKLYKK